MGTSTANTSKIFFLIIAIQLICLIILLITTIVFAVKYNNEQKKDNPIGTNGEDDWPSPSYSPLGVFAKATVAADNEYCSQIGRDILLRGGNAVDAAIAAMFCIGIMDSHSAGIGGGHFMTIYNATTQSCHVIDAREVAPAIANSTMFIGRLNMTERGWLAIAVPGHLHGMWNAYTNFGGAIAWNQLVQPTIDLLTYGYPTSTALAEALDEKRDLIKADPAMQSAFINKATGDVYKRGEQITSRTTFRDFLVNVANSNASYLYDSEITEKIAAEFRSNGGLLTADDFRNYKSIIRDDSEVIYTELRGKTRKACGPPPPSSGAVMQTILGIMDGYEFDDSFNGRIDMYHRYIEASKFAFASRSLLGDMGFSSTALAQAKNMTNPLSLNLTRLKITDMAHDDAYYGGDFEFKQDHGTTHISVIDAFGNAVSVTSTINLFFGAAVASESTGIIWNDSMDDFSTPGLSNYYGFPPSPANFIEPGKRPMSSMSPTVIFATDGSDDTVVVGGAGGSAIVSGVAGIAMQILLAKKTVKFAIDAPRLHNQLRPNITQYEKWLPKSYVDALKARGHNMVPESGYLSTMTGAYQNATEELTYANSDFRRGHESVCAGY